ncbi:outer membrane porin, OprD family [Pseudomonas delhiensis]|uniref:Outer membrane porin, OprD family n=1 Tax=Pseudomonas delhiensis TaxID=366289 RepID=A0A239JI39_9PSED|nr:OprD family porin [Pseudomonas delhiensis]SDH92803.1 outer membrane porin, OprD family [Pseudomonas delhiensis]SNT05497.1 outer membrane porin, OprD family [Pseudomonas delhiensis]
MIRKNYAGFAMGGLAQAVLGASIVVPAVAHADFISDSKANVELRNFYFNRDFRSSTQAQQSKQEEWGQGFILKFESGYTDGTIGVGVDGIAALGLKLDSSADRTGTGLLPKTADGDAPDDFSKGGATLKLRYEKNTLKMGTLTPKLPVVVTNDSRLLPQLFVGSAVNSTQLDGLNFDAGRLNQTNRRDSSNYEEMTVTTGGKKNITVRSGNTTNEFDYAGATYNWTKNFSTGYHYGQLDDFYKQHYLTVGWTLPIAEGQSLKSDIRWAKSTDDGGSNVDNKAFNAMVTYNLGYHAFGVGYQKMSGDTGFAYINGTDPYLVNYIQILDFANKDEKSWQARYDYNFAGLGIPGLTFMTRYVKGDNVDLLNASGDEGKEWERDTDIAYVVQEGALKGFGIKWRNATTRSDFARNSASSNKADENRLILSYTMPLW